MKENKKYVITIIILTILIVILSLLIAWKYLDSPKEPNNKDNTNENSKQNDNDENNKDANSTENQKVKEELKNIIEMELSSLNSKTKLSELTNQDKLSLAYYMFANDATNENRNYDQSFNKENLESFYNKTSLSNFKLTHENIKCVGFSESEDHILWQYNKDTEKYTHNPNHGGHGYLNSMIMGSVVSDYKIENNKYIISLKYIWSEPLEGFSETKVYGSYNDAKKDLNSLGKVNSEEDVSKAGEQYLDNNYLNIKDKLDEYVYTFEKIDDNYKLVDFYVNS